MYYQPRTVFQGTVYPPKPSPSNAKLLEIRNAPRQIRSRPISAPAKNQPLAVDGIRSEIHHGTPGRRSQSGGRNTNRLCYVTELEDENKSLQEKLQKLEKENSEMWETICRLEDRGQQDEEEEYITTTGEKLKRNRKNMETIWIELQDLKRENDTLKHNIDSLQNELENSRRKHKEEYEKNQWRGVWKRKLDEKEIELKRIKKENRQMKERKHREECEKNQWRSVWQRKLDEKEIELKRIREENREMKERIKEKNQELQQILKSKSQQYIDLQNELAQERRHTKEDIYKSQLQHLLDEKERELLELNQEMMSIKQKNTDLGKEIGTLMKTAWSTEDERRELRTKLQIQEAHNQFLNEETARLKKDLINLTGDKNSLLQEEKQYILRNEEVNKQNTELERQKQRIKSLEMERRRLQSEKESNAELYQKVLAAAEENETLQNKVNDLERHMRETRNEKQEKIKDLSGEKQKLELLIRSLCKQVSDWKTRYHNVEEERKKDLESKSEKQQSYERQLIMLKEEVKKRTKEKEDIVKEKELLDQTTVAQYETDLKKLKSKLITERASMNQKLESVMEEKQDLEKELTNFRSRVNSQLETKEQDLAKLRSDLHHKDKRLAGKERECETLKSKMTSETPSLNRNLELSKEKQNLDVELTNLRARCKQMEDERKLSMENKSEREQSSERELLQLKQNIERLQKENEDLVIEKKRHEENANSRLKTGEQQLAGVTSDLYRKDKLLKEREVELENLKSRLTSETTSLKRKVESMVEEKQDLENQLTNLRSQYQQEEVHLTADLRRQKEDNQFQKNEIESLQQNIDHLKSTKEEWQYEKRDLISRHQNQHEETKKLLNSKTHENVSLKTELQKLNQTIQETERECQQLQDQNQQLLHQIRDLEGRLSSTRENISTLSKERDKLKHEKDIAFTRNKKEHEETKNLLKSNTSENVSLKTEVQKLKQTIQETEMECQQLQIQNQQLLLKRDSNTQEYQQLSAAAKSENEILQREITRLKKAVSESSQMAKSLADLTDKAEKLEKENIKLETKNRLLNEQIQDLNTRNLRQVQVEKQQKNDLESKSKECEKYKDELSALKEKMERKTSNWQEEKETHQRQNMQLEKNKQELNKLELEIQSKENVVKNKQREIEQLHGKMTNIEKEFDKERKALSNKNKELQNQLKDLNDSANSEAQHLHGEIKSKESIISNLESLLQQFESNSSKAQEMEQEHRLREQQLASEIHSLNQRVKQKDDELHQYRRNVDSAIKELDQYRTELDSANNEIRQCRTELDLANNEIQQLRHNNQQKTQRLQSLEQGDYENKSLSAQQRKKIEEQQYIIDKLNKEKDTVIAEIKEVRKRNDDFQQTWQQFQSVLQQKEIENENFASRIRELEDKLRRMSENISTLSKERDKLKQEKDNALTRLSALAGNRLRDNNAAIADLSDENRPISLAEKFSELYDNQWTDALEALENIKIEEKTAIVCLLDLVQVVFEECKKESIHQTESLMKLTGVSPTDRDAMKKLKDFRKSIAGQAVGDVKTAIMNCHQMNAYTKEKPHCTSYINRCIEICWFMQVQDPPVVLDFSVKHGMRFDDKIYKPFTKTGKIVDYVVWPIMLLHEGGPLLQKGVAQPQ